MHTRSDRGNHFVAATVCLASLASGSAFADPVAVRHAEGIVHGFLTLRTLDGALIANGDLIQSARGDRVTSRLVFQFKDGSISDETAVFSQRGTFRLLRDHLVQKGPTFPQTLDSTIDCTTGQVTVQRRSWPRQSGKMSKRMNRRPLSVRCACSPRPPTILCVSREYSTELFFA